MRNLQNDPLLLTPGPLTTSESVKKAMVRDWGSRDLEFIAMTERVRLGVEEIAGVANGSHVCVLLQGSGTFAVEAAITSLIPRDGRVLVLVNGAYGHRINRVCEYHGREYVSLETDEDVPTNVAELARVLVSNADITHVIAVHCETTSGILNPIAEIAGVVHDNDCHLIIDAMSSFGALPLSVQDVPCLGVVASSNKCLEGVPGIGFVVTEIEALQKAKGNANSLALDIHAQWAGFESNGQWRFTPPTHVLAALDQAISEHKQEGGVGARGRRYAGNCQILIEGMRRLGFQTYLSDNLQAPIIVTFHCQPHTNFEFDEFYGRLKDKGFAIYPGKLTKADSFRMGCIGHLFEDDMKAAVEAVRYVLAEMEISL